ncbi:MAG: DUF1028 domain-containing protein [Saprospiraceae bacterium]
MKILSLTILLVTLVLAQAAKAQDTFSLLAYDEETGEIVSTGASCIDGNVIPNGVHAISSILPGIGAIHTQSLYMPQNQALGDELLSLGLSAKPLLDSLLLADVATMPGFRQYLAVTLGEVVQVAAFTGDSCYPWAGQWEGDQVVIAGNILIDSMVVVNMREAYLKADAEGLPLAEKALAAMVAVAYPGADRRCLSAGLSSRSAFLRLAKPTDTPDNLTIDIAIPFPVGDKDPVLLLKEAFEAIQVKE